MFFGGKPNWTEKKDSKETVLIKNMTQIHILFEKNNLTKPDGVVSDDDLEINFEDICYQLDSIYSMVVELKSSGIDIFFTHKKAKHLVAKDEKVPH